MGNALVRCEDYTLKQLLEAAHAKKGPHEGEVPDVKIVTADRSVRVLLLAERHDGAGKRGGIFGCASYQGKAPSSTGRVHTDYHMGMRLVYVGVPFSPGTVVYEVLQAGDIFFSRILICEDRHGGVLATPEKPPVTVPEHAAV